MICPFCQSDSLELLQDTYCCEECGGSFQVVQEPQDILLKDIKSRGE
jgi:Zn finger protein HypA/HybF involved in hydrogenase expression